MFGLKEHIIINIKSVLFKYDEIEKALIFGSRSRGDYKKTSDIDLAIFAHNMNSTRLNLLRNDLEELDIIYTVDVVDFYKISKEELKNNIICDGIVIFDRDDIVRL
ncbi:nucleotidyltransferase domain-containing protein [Clostridium chromiireducens]|uniref:Nucleotidyltransferase domain protein n=1 Tax=Clostridium chromiireducens TaxID=225345 RepID=A0A1V4IQ01_9CLOT|nr:nucleotidyltransferase domain-containing protein [Clostridium chromiireducens]OPJ61884.1 nucleotidyltransferase domain protein [Clostridium chromiireducens]